MDKPFALLIEDDRDIAALFRHVLDMAGYRSESVYDGLDAMERLATIQPDVVLLDLQLPGLSGVRNWACKSTCDSGITVLGSGVLKSRVEGNVTNCPLASYHWKPS